MRDADIRRALREGPLAVYSRDPDTRIVEELGLLEGQSRIDVAVINGHLSGYEIKSARDTLERLPAQVDFYSRVFDFVTLVAHESHFLRGFEIIPKWWGISIAFHKQDDEVGIRDFRAPEENPAKDASALVRLLWRDEALELLRSLGQARGVASKPRDEIWARLALVLTLSELSSVVRERLKAREVWRAVPIPSPCGG